MVIVHSFSGSFVEPVIAYVEALDRAEPNRMIALVLPEITTRNFWQHFLYNQLGHRLRKALMTRPNIAIAAVPYDLNRATTTVTPVR
jgi:hypothetical protein